MFFQVAQLFLGFLSLQSSNRARNEATAARKESRAISTASQKNRNLIAIRAAAKQARVRRAILANSAAATGTSGSSGELGASSAIGASFGSSLGQLQADVLTSQGLTTQSDREAAAISKDKQFQANIGLVSTGLDLVEQMGKKAAGA